MILGIGIDICDINRLSKTLERYEKKFERDVLQIRKRKKCQRSFSKKIVMLKDLLQKKLLQKL